MLADAVADIVDISRVPDVGDRVGVEPDQFARPELHHEAPPQPDRNPTQDAARAAPCGRGRTEGEILVAWHAGNGIPASFGRAERSGKRLATLLA
jgi:hypothetical protein